MNPKDDPPAGRYSEAWWDSVSREMDAYTAEERRTFGDIDENQIACYASGVCTDEEKARVEQAMKDFPAIEEAVALIRKLTADEEPDLGPAGIRLDPADRPMVLKPAATRNRLPRWLAVAAVLIAVVSIGWFARSWRTGEGPHDPKLQADGHPKDSPRDIDTPPRKKGVSPPTPLPVIVEQGKDAIEPPPTEQPPRPAVAKNQTPKATLPNDPGPQPEPEDLRAAIAKALTSQPMDVAAPDVQALRARALADQKQPSNPPDTTIREFLARSEPTDANELKYLEFFAGQGNSATQDPAKRPSCAARVLALRFSRPALVGKNKALIALVNKALASPSPALDTAFRAQVKQVDDALSKAPEPRQPKTGPRLLCVLPPGLREASVALYDDLQTYARANGDTLDPALLDFVLRARRPTDTLGMMIPVYWRNIEQLNPQEAAVVEEQWRAIMAVADLGVRVNVINRLQSPAAARSELYVQAIGQAAQRKIGAYAYVNTDGGGKALDDANAEVRHWHQLYPGLFRGLFVDNLPNGGNGDLKYFQDLYSEALSLNKDWQMIGGSDRLGDEAYLTLTPTGILCVDSTITEPKPQGWQAKYDPSRFAAVIRRSGDATPVRDVIARAAAAHYGWIYVTESAVVAREEYKTLPDYLLREASAIAELNAAIRGRVAGPATKKRGPR
jgi:hypothetical protein